MITKDQVSQALIHIHDSFNDGDADSIYELNIIEEYLKDQETKLNPISLGMDAMFLHCFATEVLKQLPEPVGDLFGTGQDCFVMDLFPYAVLIVAEFDTQLETRNFTGTFIYDAVEELADLFIASVMRQQDLVCLTEAYTMPDIDEFQLDVVRVTYSHSRAKGIVG